MVLIGRRGTTPTVSFTVKDFDLDNITDLCLVMCQNGSVIVKRKLNEVQIEGDTINVHLSQEDTLRFKAGTNIASQIKFKIGEQVFATDIVFSTIDDCLCQEVI